MANRRDEFEALLGPHFDALFGYALRLTRDRNDAEDLMQESVFRALRGFGGFRAGTNFKAWMFRITTNTFVSGKRRERRAPALVDELDVAAPASEALEVELRDAATDWATVFSETVEDELKQAVDELPEEFRLPLLLSSLGDLRYKEIAEALSVPIGTVMSRLFRARQRLRHSLRGYAVARGVAVDEEES